MSIENLNALTQLYIEMSWITGLRSGIMYTIEKRPLDPRWSTRDIQNMLAWCATGQHLGWDDDRSFQVAEALVMKSKSPGILWESKSLMSDIDLLITWEQHQTK